MGDVTFTHEITQDPVRLMNQLNIMLDELESFMKPVSVVQQQITQINTTLSGATNVSIQNNAGAIVGTQPILQFLDSTTPALTWTLTNDSSNTRVTILPLLATSPALAPVLVGTARTLTIAGTAGNISSSAGAQDLSANRTWTLDLVATAVTPGSYTYASFTVDTFGRLTAAASGAAPVPATRNITINGVTQDLSVDRTWTITVTGTANRISVSGGATATPTIDIAATYVGQASITTLGTIVTGVWNATLIGVQYGGTGANLSATGGAGQYVKQSSVGGAFTVGTIPASDIASGAALTKVDDTNVTLTLGGSPTIALLAATSLTLGWTGTLADARLSVTGVSAATYGSATQVPQIAVGLTGRITSASNVTITPAVGSLTGRSDLTGTSNQINLSASGTNALVGGNNITLSLPQDIHTAATPQFARLGLGAAADPNHLLLISGGTITADNHLIDSSVTWNNAGVTFIGWKLNVTNTASAPGSQLVNIQIASTPAFVIRTDGRVGINAGTSFGFRFQVNNAAVGTSDIAAWFNDQSQADNNAVRHIFYVKGETSADGPNQALQIAGILGGATGVTVADTWLGYLDFYVANTGTGIAKKMRIRGDGQIEIPALTHCIANFDSTGLTSEISHVADGSVLSSKGTTTAPAYRTVLGTTNQITVTLAAGSYTFSTPQNIHTSATPQFTRMGLGGAADAGYALYCASQNILMYNGGALWIKDSGGTGRWVIGFYTDNYMYLGETSNMNGMIFRPGAAEKMRLTSTGLGIGVTPGVDLDIKRTTTGACVMRVWTSVAGTATYTQCVVNADTYATFITSPSSTYTSSGINQQSTSVVCGDGSGGLNLGAIHASGILKFWTGGTTERARITEVGNLKIGGTATRATTEGTNHLDIFNGTAPVGTLANGCSLYVTTGELRVMDAAANATLLSPHDSQGYWIYDSLNTKTGKRLQIDMEKFMKFLNKKFKTDFIHEYLKAA